MSSLFSICCKFRPVSNHDLFYQPLPLLIDETNASDNESGSSSGGDVFERPKKRGKGRSSARGRGLGGANKKSRKASNLGGRQSPAKKRFFDDEASVSSGINDSDDDAKVDKKGVTRNCGVCLLTACICVAASFSLPAPKRQHYLRKQLLNVSDGHVNDTPAVGAFASPYSTDGVSAYHDDADTDYVQRLTAEPLPIIHKGGEIRYQNDDEVIRPSPYTPTREIKKELLESQGLKCDLPPSITRGDGSPREFYSPQAVSTPFVHDVPSANGSRSDEEENLNANVREILLTAHPNELTVLRDIGDIDVGGDVPTEGYGHVTHLLAEKQATIGSLNPPLERQKENVARRFKQTAITTTNVGSLSTLTVVLCAIAVMDSLRVGCRCGNKNGRDWSCAGIKCLTSDGRWVNITYWNDAAMPFLKSIKKLGLLMQQYECPRFVMTFKRNCVDVSQGIVNAFDIKGPSGYVHDKAIANLSPRSHGSGAAAVFNQPEAFLWDAVAYAYYHPIQGKFTTPLVYYQPHTNLS